VKAKRFGVKYHLHLQGRTISRAKKQVTSCLCLPPASIGFFFGLLLDPEDGSDMFLQNVYLSSKYLGYKPEDNVLHSNRCENLKSKSNSLFSLNRQKFY
jgi:hypothetical protein